MTAGAGVVQDYRHVGLSLRAHPVAFLRRRLQARGVIPCAEAASARNGRHAKIAGLILMRQRPGTAKGVMFITLEDETGIANLIVWPKLFEAQRRVILAARMLGVEGRVQREGDVVHFIASRVVDLSRALVGIEGGGGGGT